MSEWGWWRFKILCSTML